jgi:hypothetical protein
MLNKLKITLLKSKIILSILNEVAFFYYFITKNIRAKIDIKTKKINIKNAAIIFNKKHYNPDLGDEHNNKYYYAGSVVWARFFYFYLKTKCNVVLYDINDEEKCSDKFDLVLGLVSNKFIDVCKYNNSAHKILFAVNSHPYLRNKIIVEECRYYNIPTILMEVINPFLYYKSLNISDHILLLGNKFIKNTYIKYGTPEVSITNIHGMVDLDKFKKNNNINAKINIIYPAGFNGVRKGILRFKNTVVKLMLENSSIKFTILGGFDENVKRTVNKKFIPVIDHIRIRDWLSHDELIDELSSANIAVLISLEEGQVYSILESIACGCIPLISINCGIDLPEDYIINDPYDENEIYHKLKNLILNINKYEKLNKELLNNICLQVDNNKCKDFLDELF